MDSVEPQHLNSDSGEWIQGIQAKPQHLKFGFSKWIQLSHSI